MFGTVNKILPEIKFDMSACIGALDCGKCLGACAFHVLRTYTPMPEGKAQTSKDWIPIATFPSLCTGCMRCVKACPVADKKAIEVELVPVRVPHKWYKRS